MYIIKKTSIFECLVYKCTPAVGGQVRHGSALRGGRVARSAHGVRGRSQGSRGRKDLNFYAPKKQHTWESGRAPLFGPSESHHLRAFEEESSEACRMKTGSWLPAPCPPPLCPRRRSWRRSSPPTCAYRQGIFRFPFSSEVERQIFAGSPCGTTLRCTTVSTVD